MGKIFKKIFLFISTFFLITGCNANTSDITSSTTTSTSNSTSTTAESTTLWNKQVDSILFKAVGEFYRQIPVFSADSYDAQLQIQDGLQIGSVICFTKEYDTALDTYSIVLKLSNFDVNQYEEEGTTFCIATSRVSSYQMLVLQYQVGKDLNSGGYLYIMAYLYEDRLLNWPSNQIIAVIGQDIPQVEANYYQFATQDYGDITIAIIACYEISDPYSTIQAYLTTLENNGYSWKTLEDAYYCVNDETGIEIDFYYDESYEYLHIQTYLIPGDKNWPSSDLEELFPVEIPKYEEAGVRYFYGLSQTSDKALVFEIDCSNASPSSEDTYKETLENNGWIHNDEYSYEEYGYIYTINEGQDNECQIQFYYDVNGMTLFIFVLILNIE